jgi:hypothetical protein
MGAAGLILPAFADFTARDPEYCIGFAVTRRGCIGFAGTAARSKLPLESGFARTLPERRRRRFAGSEIAGLDSAATVNTCF